MVILNTLIISRLPDNSLLQILCNIALCVPSTIGMYKVANFKTQVIRLSWWNVFMCIPYILLLVGYLIWSGWVTIIANIMIVIFSTVGIYTSLNIKFKNLTN
ncbi:DUF6007 family protein [Lactobacillus mulieris]|nr:DUF6007 family protein [Lactobacillus mulieris]EEU20690.1 hypothetical protein HMPREF0525_01270 [Lactobacillus jensenii 27-2-CHN]EEX23774.1 hypothetical protein HMPREF0974_00842 [Lactobacillus jensenii 115-3-CHN]EFH29912.1 hypothetical protein HMPREF0526_10065 [Lactobacillus jensenii JV-V16]MCW8093963.1 DUF6007 family protein [Lactobacillus mulieris]MCW8105283.1 DUF6007 family protein [Lactobacillus mulieris]